MVTLPQDVLTAENKGTRRDRMTDYRKPGCSESCEQTEEKREGKEGKESASYIHSPDDHHRGKLVTCWHHTMRREQDSVLSPCCLMSNSISSDSRVPQSQATHQPSGGSRAAGGSDRTQDCRPASQQHLTPQEVKEQPGEGRQCSHCGQPRESESIRRDQCGEEHGPGGLGD